MVLNRIKHDRCQYLILQSVYVLAKNFARVLTITLLSI